MVAMDTVEVENVLCEVRAQGEEPFLITDKMCFLCEVRTLAEEESLSMQGVVQHCRTR